MTRRTVASLSDGDTIDEVYLARDRQLRTNRNGNLYVQVELADRTGAIAARMWNAGQSVYGSFADGDLLRVQGKVQAYQGALQVIATALEKVAPGAHDPSDFVARSPTDPAESLKRIHGHIAAIGDFPCGRWARRSCPTRNWSIGSWRRRREFPRTTPTPADWPSMSPR